MDDGRGICGIRSRWISGVSRDSRMAESLCSATYSGSHWVLASLAMECRELVAIPSHFACTDIPGNLGDGGGDDSV